jgi:hypothetical protein
MAQILVSLPSDGDTIDVSDYNTPITTIVNEINGGLDNSNITANAAIAGSKLADASVTNAKLSTTAGEVGGAWANWTPTLTNLSGGTITYAQYTQIGKSIFFRFKYTLAGAGVAGAFSLTPPVARRTTTKGYATNDGINGNVTFTDDSTGALNYGPLLFNASGNIATFAWNAASTYLTITNLSSTVPFTWANLDSIVMAGSYEAE